MKTVTYDETKWKLVPVEPTQEMVDKALETQDIYTGKGSLARLGYKAMLEAAPEHPENEGWLPIETAPRDGTRILMCRPPSLIEKQVSRSGDGFLGWGEGSYTGKFHTKFDCFKNDLSNPVEPTHWRPLPEPPKGE